jgi:hypothetical protein
MPIVDLRFLGRPRPARCTPSRVVRVSANIRFCREALVAGDAEWLSVTAFQVVVSVSVAVGAVGSAGGEWPFDGGVEGPESWVERGGGGGGDSVLVR